MNMQNNQYSVFLAEDDPIIREIVTGYISSFPQLRLDGIASSYECAETNLNSNKYNLLILDIVLGESNIFDLLGKLILLPYIIFISSFDRYAIRAYDIGAIDYILKPISIDRFQQSINRFIKSSYPITEQGNSQNYIFFKYQGKNHYIPLCDIIFITAKGRNTILETDSEQFNCPFNISMIERKINDVQFIRIHKSYIINKKYIKQLVHSKSGLYHIRLKDDDSNLPVGRSYVKNLRIVQ